MKARSPHMKKATTLASVLAGATLATAAAADPASTSAPSGAPSGAPAVAPGSVDLKVHDLPTSSVKLHMRHDRAAVKPTPGVSPVRAAAVTPEPAAAPASAVIPKAPTTTVDSDHYSPIPTSARDIAERVIFKLQAGAELDNTPTSNQTMPGGYPVDPSLARSRNWLTGDAIIGTKDVLLPSLNSYFMGAFRYDMNNNPNPVALVQPNDARGDELTVRAGYAEWGRDKNATGLRAHLWIRAGRQYRQDGGTLFAHFDGITMGYSDKSWETSAFVGQRVTLYVDGPTGVVYGATARADFTHFTKIPTSLAVDWMGLTDTSGATDITRHLVAFNAKADLLTGLHVIARARLVDAGNQFAEDGVTVTPSDGFTLGRIGARVEHTISKRLQMIYDVEHRSGTDLAYDLSSPSAVDVAQISRQLGVGLDQPVNANIFGLRVDFRPWDTTEILAFASTERTSTTPTEISQVGWTEVGAAIAGGMIHGLWTTAQYKLRVTDIDAAIDAGANTAGSLFANTSGSGAKNIQEMSLDTTWKHSLAVQDRMVRLDVGGYYRIYDLVTPYEETANDGRFGARARAELVMNRNLRFEVTGEVAQPSPTLQRELSTLSSVRLCAEAKF